jgi:hypothetical protein
MKIWWQSSAPIHRLHDYRKPFEDWMRIYGLDAAPLARSLDANFATAREPVALKS